MWNWCFLERLFPLLELLLLLILSGLPTATAASPDCFSDFGEVFFSKMKYWRNALHGRDDIEQLLLM